MKKILVTALYMALAIGANHAAADLDAARDMRAGDMKKLVFHEVPKATSEAEYQLADGAGTARLADHEGRWVLLNFWATWCAPCRHEMPMLSALQAEFGGPDFEVLTLATGRNSPAGIKKFFTDVKIDNLPRHQDPKQAVARDMSVLGLPITVLIDPDGREVARLRGDADWSSDSARAIIATVLNRSPDTN